MNTEIYNTIILIIQLISVAWFITQLGEFVEHFNLILKDWKHIMRIPFIVLECLRCVSFWISLVVFGGDFVFACSISLVATIIDLNFLNKPIQL